MQLSPTTLLLCFDSAEREMPPNGHPLIPYPTHHQLTISWATIHTRSSVTHRPSFTFDPNETPTSQIRVV